MWTGYDNQNKQYWVSLDGYGKYWFDTAKEADYFIETHR